MLDEENIEVFEPPKSSIMVINGVLVMPEPIASEFWRQYFGEGEE